MASQESPVRINALLLSQAQAASDAFHRSIPEQISYWAEIGRLVESRLSPEQISFLKSGLASLTVTIPAEPQNAALVNSPIDIVALARTTQTAKETEKARKAIQSKSTIRYQASRTHPGLLEQVSGTGEVLVGQFRNGKFKKAKLETC